MKRFFRAIGRFFAPSADSPALIRIAPYVVVAFLMVVVFAFATFGWEYTNTVKFCGLTCHTMPPQYETQQRSAHAAESCEDCHLGRDTMNVMIPRKIYYSWHTGTSMLLGSYKYPIFAKDMTPARTACENCHNPSKFSGDKLFELKRFSDDKANTLTTIYMMLKTGGGSKREGLGFGIHWHVENPVYFYAEDTLSQNIPYVLVTKPDGTKTEYIDTESKFDPKSIKVEDLQVMDCITCHNRTAHDILSPSTAMDVLMGRGIISPTIPDIHKLGSEAIGKSYPSQDQGLAAIAGLEVYYQQYYADFYAKNTEMVKTAVASIKEAFTNSVLIDQKMNWQVHPDNLQHKDFPGCFRCHDGKHVTADGKDTVRLECNLCHSIPTVSTSFQLVAQIPVVKGFEPENHLNPHWINLHRTTFDQSCKSCHTVEDPGGVSNKSFCSNSICHGTIQKFAGFDAPKLREVLKAQQPTSAPTPTAAPTTQPKPTLEAGQPTVAPTTAGPLTYAQIGPILEAKCGACHGENAIKGLSFTTYAKAMAGSSSGPVIVTGKPDDSVLVKVQSASHPGQLSDEELAQVKKWIAAGAVEK